MSRGASRRIWLLTTIVSLCCSALLLVRWVGSDEMMARVAPLGLAPFFAGTVAVHCAYFLVQAVPGGRDPIWIPRAPIDGWTLVLVLAMLCAALAAAPTTPDGPDHMLIAIPFVMISTFLVIDRVRRVQRQLAQQPA